MSSPSYPASHPPDGSVGKIPDAEIIDWMKKVEDPVQTESDRTVAAKSQTGSDQEKLDEVQRAVNEYGDILTNLKSQSVQSSDLKYLDAATDEEKRSHMGSLIMELKESEGTSDSVNQKASALSADCHRMFGEMAALKKRNEKIESSRRVLSQANKLTQRAVSAYQQGSTSDFKSLFNQMAEAHHQVNAMSESINEAVTRVSEVYKIEGLRSFDHRHNLKYGLDANAKESKMQDHTLISELRTWRQLRSQVENTEFPAHMRRFLPERYNSLLSSVQTSPPEDSVKTFGTFYPLP